MLTLVIGNKNYSSWSLRPWVYLAHHGIRFEERRIPLYVPGSHEALLEHAPTGLAPSLQDGDVRVWESIAILEYLAERFPATCGWPSDASARARARAISAEMHAGFRKLRQALPMNCRRVVPARDWPAEVQADIDRVAAIWTGCLEAQGTDAGSFLFGAFGVADAMFAPVAFRFRTYSVALPPKARAYCGALLALPAMQSWLAGAVAETETMPKYDSV